MRGTIILFGLIIVHFVKRFPHKHFMSVPCFRNPSYMLTHFQPSRLQYPNDTMWRASDLRWGFKLRVPSFSQQLGTTLIKMSWLLGRMSRLSTSNKLLIYEAILKSIWTYGIQLWGTASTSNIKILERFQSKALRMMDAPKGSLNTNS
jgi:hypothetical protein